MSTYPRTSYEPEPVLVDLSDQATRERLSKGGLKAFFNVVDKWKVKDEDARKLLGGVSNGTYYKYKKNPDCVLGQDALTRISFLIGIFKALNILHSESLANKWVQLPNSNRIFNNFTPLEYMLRGGTPAMQMVRRLLDARRGGV